MRRRLPFLRLVLGLGAALLLTAAAGLWLVRIDRVAIAPGRLAGGSVAVRSSLAGRVAEVLVDAGASVSAGQPVVLVESDTLRAEVERLELRIESDEERIRSRRAELGRLRRELHPGEIEQAKRAVERARLELAQAEVQARAMSELGREGLASRLKVEEAELARQLAGMALEDAERAVPLLASQHASRLAGIEADIRSVEGQIAEERTGLAEMRRLVAASTVSAEFAGVVVGNDLEELRGRQIAQGEELLRLAVSTAERFEGSLADGGRSVTRIGRQVKIRLDGYPWLIHGVLVGRVERVADRRDAGGGFPVTISFDASTAPGPLYEGMRGSARIIVEEKVSLGRLLIERMTKPDGS